MSSFKMRDPIHAVLTSVCYLFDCMVSLMFNVLSGHCHIYIAVLEYCSPLKVLEILNRISVTFKIGSPF